MRRAGAFFLLFLVLAGCGQAPDTRPRYGVLLSGGFVVDGNGSPRRVQDIAIDGDRISFVGDAGAANITAETVIDASGLVVAPGFIDPHTHTLGDVLEATDQNQLALYLTQGVTTVVAGNDGRGPVDIEGTLEQIDQRGTGPNVALFVGHGSIREHVLGLADRAPTPEELTRMREQVRTAMQAGALGLSSGLYYTPGSFAQTDEVIDLTRIAGEFGGVYESHIRDESSYSIGLIGAVKEAIQIGREAGVPVHLAHIKALGVDVWGQSADVINLVESAQADGMIVTADQYPWLASGTRISNALIPNWVKAGSQDEMIARLDDPALADQIHAEMMENLRKRGGADALLLVARRDGLPSRTLQAEADTRSSDPISTAIEIVRDGDAQVASFNMKEDDLIAFMRRPWVVTSSDGTNGHPRKAASFPKKYETYVIDKSVMSLEAFVQRSSSQTADILSLCDRGRIKVGAFADIAVFDPDQFAPRADYSNPAERSSGVVHLFVNGRAVISNGTLLPELPGHPLKRGDCKPHQSDDSQQR